MRWKSVCLMLAGGILALEQGLAASRYRTSTSCFLAPPVRPVARIHKNEDGSRSLATVNLATDAFGATEDADIYYMRLALDQAREAFRRGEIPVGAVLVNDEGDVIAEARNNVEALGDASAHAELECLRAAARLARSSSWRMNDTTLYVTLEPCLMCLGSIQSFRVRRVVYGAKNHLLGAVESYLRVLETKHPFHNVEVSSGVLADECGQIMKDFFAARRQGLLPPRRGDPEDVLDWREVRTTAAGAREPTGQGTEQGAAAGRGRRHHAPLQYMNL